MTALSDNMSVFKWPRTQPLFYNLYFGPENILSCKMQVKWRRFVLLLFPPPH